MLFKEKRREAAIKKELLLAEKQEEKLAAAAARREGGSWKSGLEKRIPEKVYAGLQSAFCKGFVLLFDRGRGVIEKSYDRDNLIADQNIRDYAFQLKGRRRELKQLHKSARQSGLANMTMTTLEGIGLGALGIGMPDIVLFLGTLLRGIYETALSYGFDYQDRGEQLLILKMMAAALSSGEDWQRQNSEVEAMICGESAAFDEDEFRAQMNATASAFALDMLLLKFIQGIPVIGLVGGAANPVYYKKVMQYVQLKYKKRYLLSL